GLPARLFVQLAASPDFAKDRTLYSVSLDEGVARSTDGGERWESAGTGLEEREVTALAFSPGFGADRTIFAATDGGVWTTADAGGQWTRASEALASSAVRALTVSPAFGADKTLFAAVVEAEKADDPGAVARLTISRDGG